jgi:basic membrane protein A and related proteins
MIQQILPDRVFLRTRKAIRSREKYTDFLLTCTRGAAAGVVLATQMTGAAQADFAAVGNAKPAIILFGPTNDGGWSKSIDEARVTLENELDLRLPEVAEIPESATAIRTAAELFIERGSKIILGSAFGSSDTFKEPSEEYPDILFITPAGTINGPNLKSV